MPLAGKEGVGSDSIRSREIMGGLFEFYEYDAARVF